MVGIYNMKINDGNFIIKIIFIGNSTSPLYLFKVYENRDGWFAKPVWKETIHRDDIISLKSVCDQVMNNYRQQDEL